MIKKTFIRTVVYLAGVSILQQGFTQSTDSTKAMLQNARIGRGVNLGNALEAPSIGAWGVQLKEEYFELIAKQGFNSVRVPIRWSAHASTSEPYGINASFFQTVDWVIENSFKNGLYVIINFHHYEDLYSDPDNEKTRFLKLWELICNHYKDYSDSLVFEILNEPHGNLTPPKWNSLLFEAYNTIRQLQPDRTLIVGTASYGGIGGLSSLVLPAKDDNMILTIHYYNPFHFTHQGAGWVSGADAWLGTSWNNTMSARQTVMDEMQAVVDFSEKHNVPVYMGEFGAYSKAGYQSRVRWTNFIPRYFEKLGFSWAYWEFCSGFGIYNDNRKSWNEGLLYALLHMPMSNPANGVLPSDTINLITNADFSDSTEHWYLYRKQLNEAEFFVENGEGVVSVLSGTSAINEVALINGGIQLQTNRAYRISFDAHADTATSINVSVMQGFDPWIWEPYSEINPIPLTTEKKRCHFYFLMDEPTDHNARLRFDIGNSNSKIYFDNVEIKDLVSTNDTSHKEISMIIRDKESNDLLENAHVNISGQEHFTSPLGKVNFSDISVGYHDIAVSKKHYEKSDFHLIPVYKDTTYNFSISKKIYDDTIRIRDIQTGKAISGVNVTIGDQEKTTNLKGEVVFKHTFGVFNISAEKEGYENLIDISHTLDSDTAWYLNITRTHANAKFKISSDNKPMNNAIIALDEDTLTTNNLGIAEFHLLPLFGNYEYSIYKYGFENFSGNLTLSSDTLIYIELQKNLVDIKFIVSNNGDAVSDALVILQNDTSITDGNGLAGFYNYPINQNYTFKVVHKGFTSSEVNIYAENDTVVDVGLLISSLEKLQSEKIKIYPNPVVDKLYIHSKTAIRNFVIYDVLGIPRIKKSVFLERTINQDISMLENGKYIVKVVLESGNTKTLRFIKS